MIDSAENCLNHAAIARTAAEGPMLENVRRKHLASAKAWEELAVMLQGKPGDRRGFETAKRPLPAGDSWEDDTEEA